MNYATLQEKVANQFVTTELVPFIPTAIELAEAEFNRRVRHREMLLRSYFTLSGQYVPLPTDFLEARSVYITAAGYTERLEFLSIEQMQEKKQTAWDADRPIYYSILGAEIELLPEPSDTFEMDMAFYQRIPALSDLNPTNWLIDQHPDAYFYGALMQCAPYLGRDRRIDTWSSLYETVLESIHLSNERAEYSGGVLKMRAKAL